MILYIKLFTNENNENKIRILNYLQIKNLYLKKTR